MAFFWRVAGLNYMNYSQIAARVVRAALKPDAKAEAGKRAESHIKISTWKVESNKGHHNKK